MSRDPEKDAREAHLLERLKHIRTLDPHMPYAAVATRLGISETAARKHSKRLGLPPPQPWRFQ